MTWLRRLIIAFPLALLAFYAIAFISVRVTPPKQLNQLTIGSIGEAKILNPILSTTTADSEVNSLVFRGLVDYDENLNVIGVLAKRWEITQASTLFFPNAGQAQRAKGILDGRKADWEQWNVADVSVDDSRLVLRLSKAGTTYQDTLLPLLKAENPLPVSFVRVSLTGKGKMGDETPTSEVVLRRLNEELAGQPSVAARVHSHFINTPNEFDLVVFGATDEIVAAATKLLGSGENALGQCAVAETFPVLNEPQIVFHLHEGVKWHDGRPFTARDVEFTYQAIMDVGYASPRRPDYELVRSFEVIDDHAVRIVYRQPYAPCLLSWAMGILPRHILEGKDSQWWAANFNRSPVGLGPFRFEEWKSNQYIRLRRFDEYFEGRPHLDTIAIRVIPDMVALRLLFETGEVDFWGVDPHAIKSFIDNPRFDIFGREAPSFEYIGWNLERPLFQDVRVRRALAHAVNVQQMIDFILYGQGQQSSGPFPPQMWFCNPNIKPYEYDPGKARALLAEAGWKPGADGVLEKDGKKFEFTLITNHPNELRKDIATLVQSDLKKIGIKVEVQLYEWAVFISQHIHKHDFDACVLGWVVGYDYDQYQLWHSSQAKPGGLNHCSYVNKEADRLIELARSEFDEAKAKEHLWKFNQIVYEDQPYLFTFVPRSTGAMHKNEFAVRRPDSKGGWIEEPIRGTKAGFRVYQDWWRRTEKKP